jgi:hypothetical protein
VQIAPTGVITAVPGGVSNTYCEIDGIISLST